MPSHLESLRGATLVPIRGCAMDWESGTEQNSKVKSPDLLSTPSVPMAIGSKIYRPSRSAYFSSLREAAISAAAPDSRAAALIYESASGHVTVTSQHSALPLDASQP